MAIPAKSFLALAVLSTLACNANAEINEDVRSWISGVTSILSPPTKGDTSNKGYLRADYYAQTCPDLATIVQSVMKDAIEVKNNRRMGAFILRMFFHDAFVNGCDGSILLDDDPSRNFIGEKTAGPNFNSVRGYEVINDIKGKVEASCKQTVSCADILALAARDGVKLLGGPTWDVLLGRKDSRTANKDAANSNLPGPNSDLPTLITMFKDKGFSPRDMTALSGGHTIGRARCLFFRDRIYNEGNINTTFAEMRRKNCTQNVGDDDNLADFDVQTPEEFDNGYYKDLVTKQGLLHSDQVLYNGEQSTLVNGFVKQYSSNRAQFESDFIAAMLKMGNLGPSNLMDTEVRLNCSKVN